MFFSFRYSNFFGIVLNSSWFFEIDGVWKTEIIRDAAVIRAYVRGRQVLEEEATLADSLAPTGDVDKDKRAKKRYGAIGQIPQDDYVDVLLFL